MRANRPAKTFSLSSYKVQLNVFIFPHNYHNAASERRAGWKLWIYSICKYIVYANIFLEKVIV